jgi:hypothetical protein
VTRPRDRRLLVVRVVSAALIFALVASTAAALLAGSGGDDPDPADDPANELAALAARRSSATFHARYQVSLPELGSEDLRAVVWQQPPMLRHDLDLAAGGGVEHLSTIFDGERSARCTKVDDDAWSCDEEAPSRSEVESLFATVAGALDGEVEVRDDTVAGVSARCFTGQDAGRIEEVCVTPDGVIVRATTTEATLELLDLDREVPAQVFVIPG